MAVFEITQDNFDASLAKSDMVLLDFWASWCGPCKMFAPVFEEVSQAYPDVLFGKINTETQTQLISDFSVRSIPQLVILRQGIALFSESGVLPKSALIDLIEQAQALDMSEVKKKLGLEDAK